MIAFLFLFVFMFSIRKGRKKEKNIEKEYHIKRAFYYIWAFVLIHALFLFFWVLFWIPGRTHLGFVVSLSCNMEDPISGKGREGWRRG